MLEILLLFLLLLLLLLLLLWATKTELMFFCLLILSSTCVIPLSCSCPVDFEFQVHCLKAHKAFSIHPLSGDVSCPRNTYRSVLGLQYWHNPNIPIKRWVTWLFRCIFWVLHLRECKLPVCRLCLQSCKIFFFKQKHQKLFIKVWTTATHTHTNDKLMFVLLVLPGIIPAKGKTDLSVTFKPQQYGMAEITLQLVISQLKLKLFICTLTASCYPNLTLK